MKTLLKVFFVLVAIFLTGFIVIKLTGVITTEDVRAWLNAAKSISPWAIGLTVIALLFADLLIAIPNLTVCILSGYLLGFELGALANVVGVSAVGLTGHLASRSVGRRLLERIVRNRDEIAQMETTFNRHGFIMIALSWAAPILPEASACLSGLSRMPLWRFMFAWALGAYPYAIIAAYAGSISSLEDPRAAIYAAIGLTAFFWTAWTVFLWWRRRSAKRANTAIPAVETTVVRSRY